MVLLWLNLFICQTFLPATFDSAIRQTLTQPNIPAKRYICIVAQLCIYQLIIINIVNTRGLISSSNKNDMTHI